MKAFHTTNQRQRPIFLQIGLIISISLCLVAFEWSTPYETRVEDPSGEPEGPIIIVDPVNPISLPKMPEPPKLVKPKTNTPIDPSQVNTDPKPGIDPSVTSNQANTNDSFLLTNPATTLPYEGSENLEETPVLVPDQKPSFPGGEAAMYKFIYSIIRYPEEAQRVGVKGKVIVSFIVEKDGTISNVKILNNPYGFGLEDEAIKVIKMMPKWQEGWHGGKPVRAYFNLPINFK